MLPPFCATGKRAKNYFSVLCAPQGGRKYLFFCALCGGWGTGNFWHFTLFFWGVLGDLCSPTKAQELAQDFLCSCAGGGGRGLDRDGTRKFSSTFRIVELFPPWQQIWAFSLVFPFVLGYVDNMQNLNGVNFERFVIAIAKLFQLLESSSQNKYSSIWPWRAIKIDFEYFRIVGSSPSRAQRHGTHDGPFRSTQVEQSFGRVRSLILSCCASND